MSRRALIIGLSLALVGPVVFGQTLSRQWQREGVDDRAAARLWADQRGLPHIIRSDRGRTMALMRLDKGIPVYYTTHNVEAARTTRAASLYPDGLLGLNLTGRGIRIGIWDGGHVMDGHREFDDRLRFGDGAPSDRHATHVGGTLVAAGHEPRARGMAYEAELLSFDWQSDVAELLNGPGSELILTNHSYGPSVGWTFANLEGQGEQWYWTAPQPETTTEDERFGFYDVSAERFDRVAYEQQGLLSVISAGNDRFDTGPVSGPYAYASGSGWIETTVEARYIPPDGGLEGYDTIAGAAVGKNVLTVGSVGDRPADDLLPRISLYSSFGPTDDGRIKPDLMANGEGLYSTDVGSSSDAGPPYRTASGTSMAAANATGTLALLQQYHRDTFGAFLSGAALKALVLHTADDLDQPGPDYRSGWGLLNAERAVTQMQDQFLNPYAIGEWVLTSNQPTLELDVVVLEDGPVRLSLAWTDPVPDRGTDGPFPGDSTPLLVHDLDLTLIDPTTNTIYRPYTLDPAFPSDPARPGRNTRDTIEQVYVDNLKAGSYRVRVESANSLQTPTQSFALVMSGLSDRPRFVSLLNRAHQVDFDGVMLEWETRLENRSGRFILERASSSDSTRFATVATVESAGSTPEGHRYEVRDDDVTEGTFRYRLLFETPGFAPTVEDSFTIFVPASESIDFRAEASFEAVRLNWTTRFERAPYTFELLRSPTRLDNLGGIVVEAFVPVGQVAGLGPSATPTRYEFEERLLPAGTYRYHLEAIAGDGSRFPLDTLDVEVTPPVEAGLEALYPNPFSTTLNIVLDLPATQHVRVELYDMLGRRMAISHDGLLEAGRHALEIRARDWSPGVYTLRIDAEHLTLMQQVVLF